MTLIIGYNFRIIIEDQMYCDLVEGTTDILTIPFTKDSIFKGDFLTLSPCSNPNKHADFEIIGHVTSVEDKNGTPIKKTMRVKQIVNDSNKDVLSSQNHMKYLKAVDKRIDHKLQKLGDQIRSNLMTIEEHDRRIDNYNYQMSELMNENKTLKKEMDDLNHLKQYISNEIQLCEDEING